MVTLNMRTAATILISAAIFVALAASGNTSTNSNGSNTGGASAQSGTASGGGSKPAKRSGPHYTLSQQNAIKAAKDYLNTAAFSKEGLIQQLASSAGDGYPHKDAVFAVNHLHVNWNQEAVQAAKDYLNESSFSCEGLTEQLSSSAGDQYTEAQAQYAAKKVGIC
jgi:hypothetical protein